MKIGETYTVHAPNDEHVHGRKFKVTARSEAFSPVRSDQAWECVDAESGDKRIFRDDDVGTLLRLTKP